MERSMRFLRLPQVTDRTGYKKTKIYEMISNESFPVPVQLGSRAVAWIESEVEAWMQKRIDARDNVV